MKNSSVVDHTRLMALNAIEAMSDFMRNLRGNFHNEFSHSRGKNYGGVINPAGSALSKKADEHNIGMGIHCRSGGAFPASSLMGANKKAARKRFYTR